MTTPSTAWEAEQSGWADDKPIRCSRCGLYDYPDEMLPVDGELICKACAEVTIEVAA